MVTHVTSERLVRASVAAGFAMAEALADGSGRDPAESAVRRVWRALEQYLAHYLAGASPSNLRRCMAVVSEPIVRP